MTFLHTPPTQIPHTNLFPGERDSTWTPLLSMVLHRLGFCSYEGDDHWTWPTLYNM